MHWADITHVECPTPALRIVPVIQWMAVECHDLEIPEPGKGNNGLEVFGQCCNVGVALKVGSRGMCYGVKVDIGALLVIERHPNASSWQCFQSIWPFLWFE